MSDSESERRRQLECLRLASDLTQLATEAPDPDLKARFLRSARMWSELVEQPSPDRN
jgi:hypothetical protein